MTKIKVLAEPTRYVSTHNLPQCEDEVKNANNINYRLRTMQNLRCTFKAHYEINGKKLCTRHAGLVALGILMGK